MMLILLLSLLNTPSYANDRLVEIKNQIDITTYRIANSEDLGGIDVSAEMKRLIQLQKDYEAIKNQRSR